MENRIQHIPGGLTFTREDDGAVRIERQLPRTTGTTHIATLDADQWCWLVAGMSAAGKYDRTFAAAHALHDGE